MSQSPRYVLLCECWDAAELQLLRAVLESSGIPVRTVGEHTHGVLGAIDAAAQKPRILVPEQALVSARTLAEEIVGPFDEELVDAPDDEGSPFRRAGELDFVEKAPRVAPSRSPRRPAVLWIIGLASLAFPVAGAGHVYVGFGARGLVLWLLSLGARYLMLTDGWRHTWLLLVVVLVDLVGSLRHAKVINLELERARANDDDDDDGESDDPPVELGPAQE